MDQTADHPKTAKFGLAGFILGTVSILIIVVQLSAIFASPPPKSAGTVIGEIAADIKQSAARALTGEPAPVAPPPPADYGPMITTLALCMAGAALVAGGIGLYRHEPARLPFLAVGFGITAFVMQYVFWLAIAICGVILLVAILNNLDGIFEF